MGGALSLSVSDPNAQFVCNIGQKANNLFFFSPRIGPAGGAAYVFAKRAVNADRAERHQAQMKRRQLQDTLEERTRAESVAASVHANDAGGPSQEAEHDPAPTRHSRVDASQRVEEKGKYEASEPYRSKKGNRLS
jgi:hypothetical protein